MFETVLLIVLVVVALALIGLVLIQQGKGADAGASFGGGASQTVFGSAGSGNFLTKSSWFLAGVFFIICLGLAYIAREKASGGDFSFEEPEQAVVETIETDVPQYEEEAASSAADVPAVPAEAVAPDAVEAVPAAEEDAEPATAPAVPPVE
ncbi:MAG: preprotein translocase subunit SecG [Pseudomonadota bacterium]|nr:preprotein translocase subunit SecG [Pseudomonadota bacterium]